MNELTTQEMLGFIYNFVSKIHDYDPIFEDLNRDVIGCYNSKYHGNIGQAIVNPPTEDGEESFPRVAIAYLAMSNGDIIACDNNLRSFNLFECYGDSIENVYNKMLYTREVKEIAEKNGGL